MSWGCDYARALTEASFSEGTGMWPGAGGAEHMERRGYGFMRCDRGWNWVGWELERWSLKAQLWMPGHVGISLWWSKAKRRWGGKTLISDSISWVEVLKRGPGEV